MDNKCGTCKHHEHTYLQCRRRPPIVAMEHTIEKDIPITVFPQTDLMDWCGEYKKENEND